MAAQNYDNVLSELEIARITTARLKCNNFKLKKRDFKPFYGEGLMGTHFILTTTIEASTTFDLTYFIKQLPQRKSQDDSEEAATVFEKEIFVYNLFTQMESEAACIKSVVPACYLTRGHEILVLQDLMSDGYRLIDKNVKDLESMLLLVKSLATYHAASIIYEEKLSSKLKRPYRLIDDYQHELREFYYDVNCEQSRVALQASIKCVHKCFDIFEIKKPTNIDQIFEKLFDLVKPSRKIRNTLCHGDLWSANVMVKTGSCKLIDFQYSRYAPPTTDLLTIIYVLTNKDFRREHITTLFDNYYEQFETMLTLENLDSPKIFPRDVFLESCEEYKLFGVLKAAYFFPIILMNEKDRNKMLEMDDFAKIVLYGDVSVAFDYVEENKEEYFARLKECVMELKYMCDLYL